jgi:hypothetical protein
LEILPWILRFIAWLCTNFKEADKETFAESLKGREALSVRATIGMCHTSFELNLKRTFFSNYLLFVEIKVQTMLSFIVGTLFGSCARMSKFLTWRIGCGGCGCRISTAQHCVRSPMRKIEPVSRTSMVGATSPLLLYRFNIRFRYFSYTSYMTSIASLRCIKARFSPVLASQFHIYCFPDSNVFEGTDR